MDFKDYYSILGVPREASADEVKKAYRRLARKYHPDVSKEPDAALRMSEVNEANAVLSDAERRAAYDAVGQGRRGGEAFTPPPDWDAGFEFSGRGFEQADPGRFSDFFETLFRRADAGSGSSRRQAGGVRHGPDLHSGPGGDHHAKIVLELEDLLRGAQRRVTLHAPHWDDRGHLTLGERTLDVSIPPGMRPGQMMRLRGQGEPGRDGAPPGDLFLEVQMHPHARFKVQGADLAAELPVAPWEAALGSVVPVELADGSTLQVRVPAGAQGGQVLTVRGKGLPGKQPGDLELLVRVVLPSGLEPRARRLYEAMARELPDFDARKVAGAAAERGE